MPHQELTFRFHPAGLVALNARPAEAGGCICAGAPSAGTSAVATTRRRNMPQHMHIQQVTRSSAASNQAKTGSSTIPAPSFSPDRSLSRRRITPSIKAFRARPHASRLTDGSTCTDGGARPNNTPLAVVRMFEGPGLSIGRMKVGKVHGRSGRKL